MPRKQDLDASPEKIVSSGIVRAQRLGLKTCSSSVESSGKNAGVVEHDEIVGAQPIGEIAELAIPKHARGGIHLQKTRRGAVCQRFLGNEFLGQLVVEVGDKHAIRL